MFHLILPVWYWEVRSYCIILDFMCTIQWERARAGVVRNVPSMIYAYQHICYPLKVTKILPNDNKAEINVSRSPQNL